MTTADDYLQSAETTLRAELGSDPASPAWRAIEDALEELEQARRIIRTSAAAARDELTARLKGNSAASIERARDLLYHVTDDRPCFNCDLNPVTGGGRCPEHK